MVGYITGSLTRKLGSMLVLRTLSQQEADTSVLNIAGRQRMLSQRMAKEALAVKSSNSTVADVAGRQRMLLQRMAKYALLVSTGEPGATDSLTTARDLFDTSLENLIDGDVELGMPAATPNAIPALQDVQGLWIPFT